MDPTNTPPAGTPPANTPPSPPAPPTGTPPPAGHGIAWLPADADAELVGHVQNKGWQSPADAAKAHREAEKLIGADRAGRTLVLPTDENDTAGWGKVFDRLGRPASADAYKIAAPDGQDQTFAKATAAKFHELGVPLKQGQALAAWWNEQAGAMSTQQAAAEQQAWQAEDAQLTTDWGAERTMRTELARRAAVQLGIRPEAVDALQKVSGFSGVMKAFAKVGDMLREHGAEGLSDLGSMGVTPEGAKAKRAQLMADKEWVGKAMVKNSAQWAELQKLDKIIAESMS